MDCDTAPNVILIIIIIIIIIGNIKIIDESHIQSFDSRHTVIIITTIKYKNYNKKFAK